MTHFDHLARKPRKRKTSAARLAARLDEWCRAHDARILREAHKEAGEHGHEWALPLADGGELVIHAPYDSTAGDWLTINTRFVGSEGAHDSNPYSGKWNFACYEDEDELFDVFTRRAAPLSRKEG